LLPVDFLELLDLPVPQFAQRKGLKADQGQEEGREEQERQDDLPEKPLVLSDVQVQGQRIIRRSRRIVRKPDRGRSREEDPPLAGGEVRIDERGREGRVAEFGEGRYVVGIAGRG